MKFDVLITYCSYMLHATDMKQWHLYLNVMIYPALIMLCDTILTNSLKTLPLKYCNLLFCINRRIEVQV